jgi:hypothetical protein
VTSRSWIIAIVVLGAALRFVPVWFGLPYPQARPDETTALGLATSLRSGDLNPNFFNWPSLSLYLFAGIQALLAAVRTALGMDGALSFEAQAISARALVAAAGTLTIAVVCAMTRGIAGARTALTAAFFLAVSILHVRDSHFAMTDVLMTCFATTCLWLLLRALDTSRESRPGPLAWFALAGLAGGFATSTKYNAAALGVAMVGAQAWLLASDWRSWRQPRTWLPSIIFALAMIGGFVVGTPYSILDYRTFSRDVRFELTHLSGGHGIDLGRGWTYHLTTTLPYGLGIPVFIAALAGTPMMVRRYPRQSLVLGSFALAFFGVLGGGRTVFFRYVLPLVPLLVIPAALATDRAAHAVAARWGLTHRVSIVTLALLVGGWGLVNCIWFDVLMARTDSRVLAAQWLAPQVTPSHAIYDSGGDYTRLRLVDVSYHPWWFDSGTQSFGHPTGGIPDWMVLYESPLQAYTQMPTAVLELARNRYSLVHTIRATRSRPGAAVFDLQDAFFMPISRFDEVRRPGPTIHIYKRRQPQTFDNSATGDARLPKPMVRRWDDQR